MTFVKKQLVNVTGGETADSVNYDVRWLVTMDDKDDGPFTVRNAVGVTYGDTYVCGNDTDPRAIATDIKEACISEAHFFDWYVDIQYRTHPTNRSIDNPLDDPPEITCSWQPQTKNVMLDYAGNVMTNTAGDWYAPYQAEDNVPVVNVSINQASFNWALAETARNAVNLNSWRVFGAKKLKVSSMGCQPVYHRIIGWYYKCNYQFQLKPDTWRLSQFSAGTRYKNGAILQDTVTLNGQNTSFPVFLNASGGLLGPGQPLITQQFQIYPELDYASTFGF